MALAIHRLRSRGGTNSEATPSNNLLTQASLSAGILRLELPYFDAPRAAYARTYFSGNSEPTPPTVFPVVAQTMTLLMQKHRAEGHAQRYNYVQDLTRSNA